MPELENIPDSAYVVDDNEWRFIYCENEESANSVFGEIRGKLSETFDLRTENRLTNAFIDERLICIVSVWNRVVIISYFISELLDTFLDSLMFDERVIRIAYVSSECVLTQIGEFSFEASTGYLQKEHVFEDFDDMLPKSIFRLLSDDDELGKARVKYCHFDMGDINPTIEAIEIVSTKRHKGLGSEFLKQIEEYFTRCGFELIRAENVYVSGFFKENGYELNLDEGYKYLE